MKDKIILCFLSQDNNTKYNIDNEKNIPALKSIGAKADVYNNPEIMISMY